MLSKQSVVVLRDQNVLSSSVEGQVVLLNLEKGSYYTLDAVGADIWQMLDKPVVVGKIIAKLLQDYDATPEQIENDVLELLTDLGREGLILIDGQQYREEQSSQKNKGTAPGSQPQTKRDGLLSRFTRRGKNR